MIRSLFALVVISCSTGCSTTSSSNTARTGTEQLLISNAIDQAISKVDFAAFEGYRVFLDEKYLDGVDKQYLIATLRHRILHSGGKVAADAKEADIVLEMRSGGIGTDTMETFYGIPKIVIPGMVSIPELKFVTRNAQTGTAKLGFVAYNPKTAEILGQGGVAIATSDQNNWNVLGIGPFKHGSLKKELKSVDDQDVFSPASGLPQVVSFDSPHAQTAGHIRLTGSELPIE
jgi:hypothetical protein